MKKHLFALALIGLSSTALASNLNLFSQPNANSSIVGQAPEQEVSLVQPLQTQGNWVKVTDQQGQEVWVSTTPQLNQAIAQERAKLRNEYIQAQMQRFDQVKNQMMQQYNQVADQMQQQWNTLQAQFDASDKTTDAKDTSVKRQFTAINIQYDGNGKTATVTKEWLDSDGKIQKETKTVPISEIDISNS